MPSRPTDRPPPLFHSEIQSSSLPPPVRPGVPEDLAGYRQRFELSGREYSLSSLDALITPIKYSNTLECIIHRSASFSSPFSRASLENVQKRREGEEAFFDEIPSLTLRKRKRNLTPSRDSIRGNRGVVTRYRNNDAACRLRSPLLKMDFTKAIQLRRSSWEGERERERERERKEGKKMKRG